MSDRAKKAAEELYVISTLGDGAGSWIVPESKLKDELHKAYCSCGAESWQECQTNGVVDYVAAIDDEDNWTHDFPDYKRHVFEDRGEDYTLRVIRLDESKHFPSDDLLEAEKALGVIAVALAEPAGGEYWSARKLADEWGIYNDDLDGDRVLLRIAEKALGRLRAAIAGKEGGQ